MLFLPWIGPDRPVSNSLLTEVLVDNPSHPVLLQWRLQCQAMNLSGLKFLKGSAEFTRDLILGLEARFERVVMGHKNLRCGNLASMDSKDSVLQDVGIVVKVVRRKLARNLDELGRKLQRA